MMKYYTVQDYDGDLKRLNLNLMEYTSFIIDAKVIDLGEHFFFCLDEICLNKECSPRKFLAGLLSSLFGENRPVISYEFLSIEKTLTDSLFAFKFELNSKSLHLNFLEFENKISLTIQPFSGDKRDQELTKKIKTRLLSICSAI